MSTSSHGVSAAAEPPKSLEEVITPGSLAAVLPPEAWQPLRELVNKIDDLKSEQRLIDEKLTEVAIAIQCSGARRVADVATAAERFLAGKPPLPAAPEPAKEGLEGLAVDQLRAIKTGLEQKAQKVKGEVQWLTERARTASRELVHTAAIAVAERYADVLAEAESLRVQIGTADRLLGGGIVPDGWRSEKWAAPLVGIPRERLRQHGGWGLTVLASFESGAGELGGMENWKTALRAATGLEA